MRHRLLTAASIASLALLAGACDLLDEPCPEGHWRPRAMHECEPVPTFDGGTDAGLDAAAPMDAAAELDASGRDGAVTDGAAGDGGIDDAGAEDGAAGDSAVDDAAVDAGTTDAA